MFSRAKISILLAFFLMLNGCQVEKATVFKTLPTGRSLATISSVQLIDDFNASIGKTKIETDWQADTPGGGKLVLALEKEDGLNKFGSSLALNYQVPPHKSVSLSTASKGLDLSQAEYFAFLIRKEELAKFNGNVFVTLKDLRGNKARFKVQKYASPFNDRWQEVVFSRATLKKLDFDQLTLFELELANPTGQMVEGKIVVDEIGFFGKKDIVFESARDNLKGFPEKAANEARRQQLLKLTDDKSFVKAVAEDTWRYFENLTDVKTGLPVDHVRTGRSTGIGSYSGPTNFAFYWMACVGATDLSIITKEEAVKRIDESLKTLERLRYWDSGLYYNYYNTRTLGVTTSFVSTVDNAWLAAGLIIIRQAFKKEFDLRATKLLERMNFSRFYDPSNGQMRLGFDEASNALSPYHYGLLVSESRLASYIAIGKNDLQKEHWARIYRTPPPKWDWQRQVPEGRESTLFGISLYEGHYTYLNKNFVPSWGGSLFEFLSPALFINEAKFAPKGLGKNGKIATELQIVYALQEKSYPFWGIAPCAIQYGRQWQYHEYGVPELGVKGYPDEGIITPYASFLALGTKPVEAVLNLRKMLEASGNFYGEYGFYDSIDLKNKAVNQQYLLLDQGMSFAAMVNYLKNGLYQNYFHADPIGKNGEALLKEEFSIGKQPRQVVITKTRLNRKGAGQ